MSLPPHVHGMFTVGSVWGYVPQYLLCTVAHTIKTTGAVKRLFAKFELEVAEILSHDSHFVSA